MTSLLRILFLVDSLGFRVLRALIGLVDRVIPFGKRRLVLCCLAIYVLGETGAIVTEREALTWILGPMFVMVFVLLGLDRGRRAGLEHHLPSLVLRLAVCGWMLPTAALDLLRHHRWQGMAAVAYVVLFYAIDLNAGGPRARRRLLDRIRQPLARPGFSTAS